jgi:hypothetical protein
MVNLPEPEQSVAKDIHNRLGSIPSWRGIAYGAETPAWYSKLLTALVLTADAAPISYLSATYDDSNPVHGEVVLFSDRSLIVGSVAGPAARVTIEVAAYRRSDLKSMGVTGSLGVLGSDVFQDWPGRLSCTLRYSSLSSAIELPLDRAKTQSGLPDLIKSLRIDLLGYPDGEVA